MISHFEYRKGELHCEQVPVSAIVEKIGTPAYIYSRNAFRDRYRQIHDAFSDIEHITCYSVKSNASMAVLRSLAALGCGFDIVSGGELDRVIKSGGDTSQVVFAGVGKTEMEIESALNAGILMFNVESEAEMARIDRVARRLDVNAPVALRVNPDVDPKTHKYTTTGKAETKFGMDFNRTAKLIKKLANYPNVVVEGIHAHLGSPINTVEPYAEALDKIIAFIHANRSDRAPVNYINTGGGFGIDYTPGQSKPIAAFAEVIVPRIADFGAKLILEPGRYISGNSGIFVARIQYIKDSGPKRFWITDGGMNDLIRPALYEAFHEVWPVKATVPPPLFGGKTDGGFRPVDVVGPVCETADFFAKDRPLPDAAAGDLIAVFSAGAYGSVMAGRYNQRPLVAEAIVDGDTFFLSRRRETYDDMTAMEIIPEGW